MCALPKQQGYVIALIGPLWQSPSPTLLVKFIANMPTYCLPQPELQLQAIYSAYTPCFFTIEIAVVSENT